LNLPGVVIRGEPGIGKSRLAAAAAELADSSGAVVLELVGSPFHTDAGLHPVRTLLERRCGIGRLTDQAERLRLLDAEILSCSLDPDSLVPLLAPVLGVAAEPEQSDALAAALAPTLTAAARAVVVGRCDGLPFYIEQVVDDFSQTGVPEALYEPL